MNLLTRPDTAHLLGASLESLHEESISWLEEISFWQNEMAFFYKLLNKRMPTKTFPSERLSAIEKKLVDIQASVLDQTKKELLTHDRRLVGLLQNPLSSDEENFREEHKKLLFEIYSIHDLIKRFKNEVFSLF